MRKTRPSDHHQKDQNNDITTPLPTRSGYAWSAPKADDKPPSRASILFKVELALSRMESGDYGYCVICNHAIAIEELDNDPSIVSCGECRHS